MAPRSTRSTGAPSPASTPAIRASSSNPRKRRGSSPTLSLPSAPTTAPSLGTLEFGSDGEDDDVLARSDDADDSEGQDEFPELDLEAGPDDDEEEEGTDGGEEDSFDGSEGDDEEELDEILSSDEDDSDEDLDSLLARHTTKPVEDEAEPSAIPGQNLALGERGQELGDLLPDFMQRSKTVRSKVTGQDMTVWDEEIEPDYASDSSTEEVRFLFSLLFSSRRIDALPPGRPPIASVPSPPTGTTPCPTSVTTSMESRSCVLRRATNSTSSWRVWRMRTEGGRR
jgi:ribosome biogenesis protein ERB1